MSWTLVSWEVVWNKELYGKKKKKVFKNAVFYVLLLEIIKGSEKFYSKAIRIQIQPEFKDKDSTCV